MTMSISARQSGSRRRIAAVTVARSDYGISLPVYRAIMASDILELQLIVTGAHLSPRYGHTIDIIKRDGLPIAAAIDMLANDTLPDTPAGIVAGMGIAMAELAKAYESLQPDVLLVLGDRIEMAAAVLAAQAFGIPVAHMHGGEVSLGAIDDALRHAITKMSSLHFVSHEDHARRVIQMGASPAQVVVAGAPGLDHLANFRPIPRQTLAQQTGLNLPNRLAVVVFHPVTRQPGQAFEQMQTVLLAMQQTGFDCAIGYPNADAGNHRMIELIEAAVAQHSHWQAYRNLSIEQYHSLLSYATVLVGNSSSGIIEAASLKLPVVNVGDRQQGRLHGVNVMDVPCDMHAITSAIIRTTWPEFRKQVQAMTNPYSQGNAARHIVQHLEQACLGPDLLMQPFHDLPAEPLQ